MRVEKPRRHWKEKFFSPESIQRDLSGLWPTGQSTGLAALSFLTGSFVKVSSLLILPSRHQRSVKIMQKAQNFLGVKVKCWSSGALGKKQASLTESSRVRDFQNLNYFLTLLHSMKRESKDLIVLRGFFVFPHGTMSFSPERPDHIKRARVFLFFGCSSHHSHLGLSHFPPLFGDWTTTSIVICT